MKTKIYFKKHLKSIHTVSTEIDLNDFGCDGFLDFYNYIEVDNKDQRITDVSLFTNAILDGEPYVYKSGSNVGKSTTWKASCSSGFWSIVLDLERQGESGEDYTQKDIFDRLWMYRYLLHPSFSYTKEVPRWRVVIPFNRNVDVPEFGKIFRRMQQLFPSCDNCSGKKLQSFYMPCKTPNSEMPETYLNPGVFLDVDLFIKTGPPSKMCDIVNSGDYDTDGEHILDGRRAFFISIGGMITSRSEEGHDEVYEAIENVDRFVGDPPRLLDQGVDRDTEQDLRNIVDWVIDQNLDKKSAAEKKREEVCEETKRKPIDLDVICSREGYTNLWKQYLDQTPDAKQEVFNLNSNVVCITNEGLKPLSGLVLSSVLSTSFLFYETKTNKKGDQYQINRTFLPSSASGVLSKMPIDSSLFPKLKAIRAKPFIDTNGDIFYKQGFSAKDNLYLVNSLTKPSWVKECNPDREWCKEKVRKFIDEYLHAFPWRSESDKMGFLCLMLTPLVAVHLNQRTPLFVLEANQPSSGKTVLGMIASKIIENDYQLGEATSNIEEARKQITSILKNGTGLYILDNVTGNLPRIWERVITSPQYSDRLLGSNTQMLLNNQTTWVATGNNMEITGDLFRRVFILQLESNVADPSKLTDKKEFFKSLQDKLENEQEDLYWTLMLVCKSFIQSGHEVKDAYWPSFPRWYSFFEGLLNWLDLPSIKKCKDSVQEKHTIQDDFKNICVHLDHLQNKTGGAVSPTAILETMNSFDPDRDCPVDIDAVQTSYLKSAENLGARTFNGLTKQILNKVLTSYFKKVVEIKDLRYKLDKKTKKGSNFWYLNPL